MQTKNLHLTVHPPKHSFNRRLFLKLGTFGTALPVAMSRSGHSASAEGQLLPEIPKLADLASDRLVHHHRDLFSPPAV